MNKRNREREYQRLLSRMLRLNKKASAGVLFMSDANKYDLSATSLCVEAHLRNNSRLAGMPEGGSAIGQGGDFARGSNMAVGF
jgi:hypothetical protein